MSFIIFAGLIITVLTAIPVLMQMRNQPKGLFVCFFAEMWERFSYYGMRALLIYYMTQHFLFDDNRANSQYGSYTTLVYMLPLIGGLVADRWIGTRKAIIFGGLLLVFGHFGMAFEGSPNTQTLTYGGHRYEFVADGREGDRHVRLKLGEGLYDYAPTKDGGLEIKGLPANADIPAVMPKGTYEFGVARTTPWSESAFFISISLIVMGVGFLKPNISSLVGQLYKDRDPRRDSGFQLYYFGINLGSFWAAILCGFLGNKYGWWAGFGLAGIGMLTGLLWFVLGRKWLEGKGEAPEHAAIAPKVGGISKEWLIYAGGLLAIPVIFFLIQRNDYVRWVLLGSFSLIMIYIVFQMVTKFTRVENYRLGLAMILTLASVVFWSLFEQAGSSLSLFAERNTNLNILAAPISFAMMGKTVILASAEQLASLSYVAKNTLWVEMGITASNTQSFNAGFILMFAPVFAAIFSYLARRGKDPDPVKKFAFGLACAGFGFLILVWAAPLADGAFKLPLMFLLLTYLIHTWGELAVSPVGLSQQTKLSPPTLIATMMAVWFLGTSGGQYLAGWIAGMAGTETVGGKVLDAGAALQTSLKTFNTIGWTGVILGAAFFGLSFLIKGWAHGASDTDAAIEEPDPAQR
ncbi:hypothetical protein AEAC466_11575 [Asticcacaulis sp. AC466]|uniref:peptide MFS transporter n=1 Tax=Asticcacaulis sp. AC466 TaxID=1282362 RepID=UPI0003C3EF53|nr:oligopeptide:H+ symporter [Asticcacaulis sp. AC466]ESQ83800.1 hypothetical protein AEAC466_11575 [Asticcacaulis sp. AC466]